MAHNKYDCCAARSAYQRCQVISDEGLISRTSPFNSFLPESYFHNRAIMATRLMVQVWLDDCSWRRCLVELCIARLHCSSGPNGALSNFDDTRIDGINFGTQEVWASLLYGGRSLMLDGCARAIFLNQLSNLQTHMELLSGPVRLTNRTRVHSDRRGNDSCIIGCEHHCAC